jgi:hypothetical protein
MGVEPGDLPQFPVNAAETLAAELDRLAGKLDDMAEARVSAGTNLPEFQGNIADQFREDLNAHAGDIADVAARFRTTAGRLRDAISEHNEDKRQAVALR